MDWPSPLVVAPVTYVLVPTLPGHLPPPLHPPTHHLTHIPPCGITWHGMARHLLPVTHTSSPWPARRSSTHWEGGAAGRPHLSHIGVSVCKHIDPAALPGGLGWGGSPQAGVPLPGVVMGRAGEGAVSGGSLLEVHLHSHSGVATSPE